jgi:hypothetical protein
MPKRDPGKDPIAGDDYRGRVVWAVIDRQVIWASTTDGGECSLAEWRQWASQLEGGGK